MTGSRPALLKTLGIVMGLGLTLALVFQPSPMSIPRVFAQSSSGADFLMQIEPNQFLMRNSTTAA